MVAMKATDTIHVSSAGAENILEGEKFDVSEEEAKILEKRGLAKRVGGEKADKAAPSNKMVEEPQNKIIGAGAIKEQRQTVKGKK